MKQCRGTEIGKAEIAIRFLVSCCRDGFLEVSIEECARRCSVVSLFVKQREDAVAIVYRCLNLREYER